MNSKVLATFAVLCLLGSCCGEEELKVLTRQSRDDNIPIEPLGAPSDSDSDLDKDSTFWRLWKFWKWDSQRTTTRRDSSLITTGRRQEQDEMALSTARGPSTTRLHAADSGSSLGSRPKGSVRKEVVTVLFEAMLDYIVESWDVIETHKTEEVEDHFEKTTSENTFMTNKKKLKSMAGRRSSKNQPKQKSRSKLDLIDTQADPMHVSWWNQPDEKAIIRFKNGNIYEGNISLKRMNGEGRFQWADGTVYMGSFRDNEIAGKGKITWKDNTWYSGDFIGNLRHGRGLYVDSRLQRSYVGEWHCSTKHGLGAICYSKSPNNTYDGEWVYNVRHGFGTREYCPQSGYQGEWDHYVREGNGLMIWPNHDYYKGEWKNGVMSGYGIYIWNTKYNNSMSVPSLNVFRGCWVKGKRSGYGILHFGLSLGAQYKGEFKENKKHGMGKIVTNNGFLIKNKRLFIDDTIKPKVIEESCDKLDLCTIKRIIQDHKEPIQFDMCDDTVGLRYHIQEAIKNLDRKAEIRAVEINDYIENNRLYDSDLGNTSCDILHQVSDGISEEMIEFEEDALNKAVRCYGKELRDIYYQYATICNSEKICFRPILIRLYLWQFYYDCDMHEKGLTLLEIDDIFAQNPNWIAKTPYGPFERLYFWQFKHSLIAVASRLYAKKCFPGPRPHTIVASAFRYFMDNDVLPNCGRCKGVLPQNFGTYVPLFALYKLYLSLGEPHTARQFLCAVNRSTHLYMDFPQPPIVEASEELLPFGRNAYVIANNIKFLRNQSHVLQTEPPENEYFEIPEDLKLLNFGNLSSKTIIKIISSIFPFIYDGDHIVNLDIPMTFFEFFQVFIACAEESIRVKEEELRWREMLDTSLHVFNVPPPARPGTATHSVATQKK